jgi:hypothetical protein
LRQHWPTFIAISALVLVPCFWHRHIVASDLGSHVYNAWLAHLIAHNEVPGLWIEHQWTNVLFDFLLSGLAAFGGLAAAEKLAVSVCVLVFFWGTFALASAATSRPPWFLTPVIALFTYGWTFHLGFFNYYLSIGLSLFCVAILWRGKGREKLIAIPLAVLVGIAHPFGMLWLVAVVVYIACLESSAGWYQFVVLGVAVAAILLVHYLFWHHYVIEAEPDPFYWFTGPDQLILFGWRYLVVKRALLIFAVGALVADVIRRRSEKGLWSAYSIPLQLYIAVELAVFLFPRGVHFPHHVAIALITERLTSISAVMGCCLLGVMRPSRWHLAASLGIAAIFFAFIYQDTTQVNRIERQAEQLVRALPPNQRVLATISALDDSRVLIQHIADRACIGHCFSYGNYEPGSGVFRVRANPGNPYVMSDYEDATDMEEGDYVVRPEDLPAYQLYQCSTTGTELCIRPLEAGEQNNRLGAYEGP